MQSLDFKAKTLISPLYLGTMALVLWLIPLRAKQRNHSKLTVRLHDPSIIAAQFPDGFASNLPARRACERA